MSASDFSTGALIAAAEQLAGTLARENAALTALDLGGAAQLVPGKAQALAAFEQACGQMDGRRIDDATQRRAAGDLSGRLQGLAQDNKRLLERAMFVQKRVIALFARAVVAGDPTSYSAQGGVAARVRAWALSAKV